VPAATLHPPVISAASFLTEGRADWVNTCLAFCESAVFIVSPNRRQEGFKGGVLSVQHAPPL
jgi:hypothetical protein